MGVPARSGSLGVLHRDGLRLQLPLFRGVRQAHRAERLAADGPALEGAPHQILDQFASLREHSPLVRLHPRTTGQVQVQRPPPVHLVHPHSHIHLVPERLSHSAHSLHPPVCGAR